MGTIHNERHDDSLYIVKQIIIEGVWHAPDLREYYEIVTPPIWKMQSIHEMAFSALREIKPERMHDMTMSEFQSAFEIITYEVVTYVTPMWLTDRIDLHAEYRIPKCARLASLETIRIVL